jgi:cation:H+ antiporter
MTGWFLLLSGGVLLYFGSSWFVGGASALAASLRIPEIVVGLTVVAYGTSAPEMIVGIQAALSNHGDIALGNVLGSNIANIGLILGTAALVCPARVDGSLRRREMPVLLGSALLLPLLLLDGRVAWWEGGGLLAIAVGYTLGMVWSARTAAIHRRALEGADVMAAAADAAGGPRLKKAALAALAAFVGLAVLLAGAHLFVEGAVAVARALGMSDRLVGLTVVAVGTSLPELVTSVVASVRGHADIAVGNVIGSNIFNILLCLGAAALAGPLAADPSAVRADLAALLLMTALAALFIRTARTITRAEGAFLLALYAAYMAWIIGKG